MHKLHTSQYWFRQLKPSWICTINICFIQWHWSQHIMDDTEYIQVTEMHSPVLFQAAICISIYNSADYWYYWIHSSYQDTHLNQSQSWQPIISVCVLIWSKLPYEFFVIEIWYVFFFSSKSQRVFISDKNTRMLLLSYAGSSGEPLDNAQFQDLLLSIKTNYIALLPLMKMFQTEQSTDLAPSVYRRFLRLLSSSSPVCSFINPSPRCIGVLEKMNHSYEVKNYPDAMRVLSEEVPVLFDLLKQLSHTPEELKVILSHLLILSRGPFDHIPPAIEEDGTMESPAGYFPTLTKIRSRQRYKQDSWKVTSVCKPTTKGHASLLPGIFCMFCEHGKLNKSWMDWTLFQMHFLVRELSRLN